MHIMFWKKTGIQVCAREMKEKFPIQTRSQAKMSDTTLPEVH